ncbi:MAG: rhodanese-like domain-containing protein [Legionellales bacterium]|nr:rhodanese-like domain-containing protein [Legionellales bacterium]
MGQLGQFITNHLGLCASFIAILLLIYVNELYAQKKRGKELSTADAIRMINHEQAVVIDLRDPEAFRAGHIIHAIRSSKDDFDQQRMNKYKNKPLILVCARGLQSSGLAATLRTQGFQQPMVLAGGITAWQTAGLPLEKKSGKSPTKK